jgi:hypothetical protein
MDAGPGTPCCVAALNLLLTRPSRNPHGASISQVASENRAGQRSSRVPNDPANSAPRPVRDVPTAAPPKSRTPAPTYAAADGGSRSPRPDARVRPGPGPRPMRPQGPPPPAPAPMTPLRGTRAVECGLQYGPPGRRDRPVSCCSHTASRRSPTGSALGRGAAPTRWASLRRPAISRIRAGCCRCRGPSARRLHSQCDPAQVPRLRRGTGQ